MLFVPQRLIQSIFLLPRYLERNHELITKSLVEHSIEENENEKTTEEEDGQKPNVEKTPDTDEKLKKIN